MKARIVIEEEVPADFRRRALPWLAALTFHAVLLAVSVGLVVSRYEMPLPIKPIEVVLDAGYSGPTSDGSSVQVDKPSSGSQSLPLPAPAAAPSARANGLKAAPGPRPRMQPIGAQSFGPRSAPVDVPRPSAQEVLADLPSGSSSEPQVEGLARQMLFRRDPQFPRMLSLAGVEVECEARITVSPAGTVTRVEIIRSSGYTDVDASVEAALREYLFSRVDGRKDAVGTIKFRFRLEKRD